MKAFSGLLLIALASTLCLAEESALAQKFSNADEAVRLAAVKEAAADGAKSAPLLLNALKDISWDVRAAAGDALLGMGADSVNVVLSGLQNEYPEIRSGSTYLLARLKPACVPPLVKALRDERAEIRAGATRGLEKIGAAGVPFLLTEFKAADAELRVMLTGMIGSFGAASKEAIPTFIDALSNKIGSPLQDKVVETFAKLGPDAIGPLVAALKNESIDVRCGAIRALGFFQPAEPRVVKALIDALKDTLLAVKESAARALGEIGPSAAAASPSLIGMLKDEHTELRVRATEALAKIEPASKNVASELIVGLKDELPVRLKSIEALGHMNAVAGDTIGPLMELIKDEDSSVRAQTMRSLALLLPRPEAPDAHLALLDALADKSAEVRMNALAALGRTLAMAPGSAGGVPKENQATVFAALVRALKDEIPTVRSRAAEVLGQNPAAAATSVPALIPMIKDTYAETRQKAVEALGTLGAAARPAIPALIAALPDGNAKVMGDAIRKIGLDPRSDVTLLIEAFPLKNPDYKSLTAEGRAQIASLLGSLGPASIEAVPQLVLASNDRAPLGPEAIAALKLIDPSGKAALPVLITQMKNKSPETRLAAVEYIKRLGPAAASAAPAMIDALKDDDYYVREAAAIAIGNFGPPSKPAVTALINALKSSSSRAIKAIQQTLAKADADSLPLLIAALKDDSGESRRSVAAVLEKMPACIPLLAPALKDNSNAMKRSVLALIAQIGPPAKSTVPVLIEFLKEDGTTNQAMASKAIEAMSADAVPALITALKEGTPEMRKVLLPMLAQMGTAAKDAAPTLALMLRDENTKIKTLTMRTLEKLGPAAVSGLVAALSSEDPEVRRMAISALGNLGAAAKSAVPALLALQKDDNMKLRRYTVNSLRQIAPDDPAVMSAILFAMKDDDPVVRMAAIKNIGSLGANGKDGVPALIVALRDDDWDNRAAAATALEDVGAPARKLFPEMDAAIGEIRAVFSCIAYGKAQESFHLKDYDRDGVLEYAQCFHSNDVKHNPGLCDAALLPRLFADAEGQPGPTVSYRGYRFKILKGQGEKAPGGAKAYIENGNMPSSHAMIAYPAEYGKTGRSVFMIHCQGGIYEKDFKTAEETVAYVTAANEFKPDETWTLTKQITLQALQTPVKDPTRPILKGLGEVKEDTTF